jgi:integrase
MSSITTADVRAFIVSRQSPITHEDGTKTPGASHAEINRELAALKRMFTLAVQAGKLLHRPHIPMLKERNTRTGFFEREQFDSVRQHLPAHLRPVITFCYLTGWRWVSEVLPLRCSQVELSTGLVRLDPHTTKNDEARVFAFAAITELRDLLTAQVQSAERLSRETEQIVSHIFHEADGSPLNEYRFREAWRTATVAAGCPGRIPHDFRRTAVRNLVRAGVPERVAMQMTGHKTRSVFERYNITSGADLDEAAARLQAFLTGAPAAAPRTAQVRPFRRRVGAK